MGWCSHNKRTVVLPGVAVSQYHVHELGRQFHTHGVHEQWNTSLQVQDKWCCDHIFSAGANQQECPAQKNADKEIQVLKYTRAYN